MYMGERGGSGTVSPAGILVTGLLVHGWERRKFNYFTSGCFAEVYLYMGGRGGSLTISPVGVLVTGLLVHAWKTKKFNYFTSGCFCYRFTCTWVEEEEV